MLALAKTLLTPLNREMVFLGGATVHLHIDDPAAAPVRSTKDVDVLMVVTNYTEFSQLEEALRENGFEQDMTQSGPICRWTKAGLLLDIMPTKPELIGFSESRWFEEGFKNAVKSKLPSGETISTFDVLHLLAAKIDAFRDRGKGDYYASQDFEDICTVLDGCTTVWDKLSLESEVAVFVREWLCALNPDERRRSSWSRQRQQTRGYSAPKNLNARGLTRLYLVPAIPLRNVITLRNVGSSLMFPSSIYTSE